MFVSLGRLAITTDNNAFLSPLLRSTTLDTNYPSSSTALTLKSTSADQLLAPITKSPMAARTLSSSSSSSETEETTTQLGATSEISRRTEHSASHRYGASASDVVDRESTSIRSRSPTASFGSAIATGTPYDTLSMATSNSANFTSTTTSRQVLSHEQLGRQANGGALNQQYQQRPAQPQMSAYSTIDISHRDSFSFKARPSFR